MTRRIRGAVASSMVLAWAIQIGGVARAQAVVTNPPTEPPTAASRASSATVSEVVVTGSALPTTPDAVAVPVEVIGADSITKGGVSSNALEILRKEIPAFEGRGNAGSSNANNTNQNTAGGSQAQIRNLDTLVLIDGRRAAINAVAGVGGKAFVDVNQIPAAAIERVEVLPDGASAIYGSDAVGGVVNFILKSNYEGADIGGRYAGADGKYSEHSAYAIVGHEFVPGLNLTVTATDAHTDPLSQSARSFSSPFYINATNIPGVIGTNILAPGLTSPSSVNPTGLKATAPSIGALIANGTYLASNAAGIGHTYDLSQFQTLLLRQDQDAVNAKFTGDLRGDQSVIVFGGVEYADNKSFTQFLPRVTGVTVPAGSPYNPLTATIGGVMFGDVAAPKQYHSENESVRATLGLRGKITFFDRTFRWEVGLVHSEDKLVQQQNNVLFGPNLPLAIAGGFDANGNFLAGGAYSKVYQGYSTTNALILQPALDPFARVANPAALANILGVEMIHSRSLLDSVDAQVTTTLFELPAGGIGVALGGGWRREALSAHTDANGANTGPTARRWIGGQFADPFSGSRTISAGFAEIRIPITSSKWNLPGLYTFDLIGAGRVEDYSDAGSSVVPKLGFRWQPIDPQITLRGTYAESFTAPTLFAEKGPTDTRFAGGTIISGAFPGVSGNPFPVEDGNNPNLKPSHSRSYSFGATVKPQIIPGLKFAGEYFSVDQTGLAGGIGFSNILLDVNTRGAASPFSVNVAMNNFPGLPGAVAFTTPGQLRAYLAASPNNAANVYAIDRFTNLGLIQSRSFDMSAEYMRDFGRYGVGTLNVSGTYLGSYKFQAIPGQKLYQYAGTATNGGTGVQGTLPKFRSYSTLDWQVAGFDFTAGQNFIASVKDEGPGGITFDTNSNKNPPTAFAHHVKSYMTFDLRAAYKFDHLPYITHGITLAVGVNDVGNVYPPKAPAAFTDNSVDVATYSPIGRLAYVTLDGRF